MATKVSWRDAHNWVEQRTGRPQILDWGKAYYSDQVDPYNARVSDRTQLSQVDLWHFPKGEEDKRVRVLFEEYAYHARNTIQHIQGMYASRHKLTSLTASLLLNEGFWGPLLMQLREHVADLLRWLPPFSGRRRCKNGYVAFSHLFSDSVI